MHLSLTKLTIVTFEFQLTGDFLPKIPVLAQINMSAVNPILKAPHYTMHEITICRLNHSPFVRNYNLSSRTGLLPLS